ncbi:MAG: HDOD domain-containing protein, partial [Phycisphaerae bacterium]
MGRTTEQSTDLSSERFSAQQMEVLVQSLQHLPALPQVAANGMQAATRLTTDHPDTARAALAELVSLDPCLASAVLRTAATSTPEPSTNGSVAAAVSRLSDDRLQATLLAMPVLDLPDSDSAEPALGGLWEHSVAVALAAEMLAEYCEGGVDPATARLAGLLHDLGKIAFIASLPKSFLRAWQGSTTQHGNLADYERQVLGTDHTVFGRRLAEHWGFSKPLRDVIWLHMQPAEAIPDAVPHRRLIQLVGLADTVARQQRLGTSGNYTYPRSADQTARQLGLADDILPTLLRDLPGRFEEALTRLGLRGNQDPMQLVRTLMDANAELGRLNESLRTRSDRLASQAEALRQIRQFATVLPTEATIADSLVYIGNTMAGARAERDEHGVDVVAYSLDPDGREMLAVHCNGQDRSEWRTLACCDEVDTTDTSTDEQPATTVLEKLLPDPGSLADWIDVSRMLHRPLVSAGRWIGGLIYPPSPEPGQEDDDRGRALCESMSMALAVIQGRSNAMMLSEQLAGASQVLAETQDVIAEIKTMATIEQMAAGAAHEMNNPLAVIAGRAQLMSERAQSDDEKRTWDIISDQAQRVSDIISELMDYAAPDRPTPREVDVRRLMEEAMERFSDSAQAASIFLDSKDEEPMPPVWVD